MAPNRTRAFLCRVRFSHFVAENRSPGTAGAPTYRSSMMGDRQLPLPPPFSEPTTPVEIRIDALQARRRGRPMNFEGIPHYDLVCDQCRNAYHDRTGQWPDRAQLISEIREAGYRLSERSFYDWQQRSRKQKSKAWAQASTVETPASSTPLRTGTDD